MRISELIMMVLIAGIFLIGGSLFMADIGSAYDVPNVPNLQALNQTAEIAALMNTTQSTMSNVTTGNPILDFGNSVWNFIGFMSSAFIKTGLLMLTSPILLTNMLTNSAGTGMLDIVHVPGWITSIILVIITTIVSFAVYRTIAKSDI